MVDTLKLPPDALSMAKARPPYSSEFRRQVVEPVRAGWADTANRSAKNEEILEALDLVSSILRKKPNGRLMPERTRRANAAKSAVRFNVEHVFAHQKGLMGVVVRTIGLARARVETGLVNLAYNMRRLVWLSQLSASA